ncbi:MAG: glutamate synthase large subunit [Candidatus Portiera sp.]|nr:glutamate synthase large subunit [Portiera sp.]
MVNKGLADISQFRDNCGFGVTAHINGESSHELLQQGIDSLLCMMHRGGINADNKTGDGCGVTIQIPDAFFRAECAQNNVDLGDKYAVGVAFLSAEDKSAEHQRAVIKQEIDRAKGFSLAGWREVPVNHEVLGPIARESVPQFQQFFVNSDIEDTQQARAKLFLLKRSIMAKLIDDKNFQLPSLSFNTVLYKGIILSSKLREFFPDLNNKKITTSICVFHQRFATNTAPQWHLAHPFQYIAHNGEVNTISGNRNWSKARAHKFQQGLLKDLSLDIPLVDMQVSDSMSLDNMLEALLSGGMNLFRSLRMLLPPAWQNDDMMDRQVYSFHEYNSTKMEAWDGPASVVMTDGRYAVCTLDRNGLRPAKWVLAKDGVITLASEMGVRELEAKDIVQKGRVEPGGIIAIDTHNGSILETAEIDKLLSTEHPYKEWMKKRLHRLEGTLDNPAYVFQDMDKDKLKVYKKLFCFHGEELEYVMRPLAEKSQEAVAAMGDDTPVAVMSQQNRLLTDYFRQNFAQVTNPAIDPIRENVVMSLKTFIGKEANMFDITDESAARIALNSPILSPYKFDSLDKQDDMPVAHLQASYNKNSTLEEAVDNLCQQGLKLAAKGNVILIVSDRNLQESTLPIPMPMAIGALHHCLVDAGLRCDVNLVAETAYAREPHHYAVLIGVGATAIYPYFAYAVLEDGVSEGLINAIPSKVYRNYRNGIDKGLLKILSKMGISTIASYRGAQLFELLGVADEVVAKCFVGIPSRIAGVNFAFFDKELRNLSAKAWNPMESLHPGGMIKFVHNSEAHSFNADVVETLRKSVRDNSQKGYDDYAEMVNSRPPMYLRDLLSVQQGKEPIDIKEVEPAAQILKRFDTAAMSLGALSPEAHETLARAMHDLGGRSNSGEGGEDIARFNTPGNSKIKQIASGRFGVTPHYLVNAEVLQIKIAQGAKPGEGGQLPGGKVNDLIARLRFSSPGVTLISPPPHHDIYSIEDLAQLIYDLKEVNPRALVSVKLVSLPGVGVVASGVAKCKADLITISGYDGGTAASPLSSIRYAGSPWELGLSETHQALQLNGFRDKVRLQTDGGLKTGLDVIKATLLGAESFGFGTTPMIAMGCKFLRLCHLNNCPTGVATQHKPLRDKHFVGDVEMVKNFFKFVAEEVRMNLAKMGYRSLEDIIGRVELMQRKESTNAKHASLDLSRIIHKTGEDMPRFCTNRYNPVFRVGDLAKRMKDDMLPCIEKRIGGEFSYDICNQDRTIGGALSGILAEKYGLEGLGDEKLQINFNGTAGQSFGAWNINGLSLKLNGSANDYVGKGMAGGKLVITLPDTDSDNTLTLAGNTCLYGATGGTMYVAGRVGERFAVRNSGCLAIVEGTGDHCCEYMTGGVVVVLGKTGINFGAGMTGGFAYVWDPHRDFADQYNEELIEIDKIVSEEMEIYRNYLRRLLKDFVTETSSKRISDMLDDFDDYVPRFWLVKPKSTGADSLLENIQNRAA